MRQQKTGSKPSHVIHVLLSVLCADAYEAQQARPYPGHHLAIHLRSAAGSGGWAGATPPHGSQPSRASHALRTPHTRAWRLCAMAGLCTTAGPRLSAASHMCVHMRASSGSSRHSPPRWRAGLAAPPPSSCHCLLPSFLLECATCSSGRGWHRAQQLCAAQRGLN